jgi:hypothetical protein
MFLFVHLSEIMNLGKITALALQCSTKDNEIAKLRETLDEFKDLQDKFEQLFEKNQSLLEVFQTLFISKYSHFKIFTEYCVIQTKGKS